MRGAAANPGQTSDLHDTRLPRPGGPSPEDPVHASLRRLPALVGLLVVLAMAVHAAAGPAGTGYVGSLTSQMPSDETAAPGSCTQAPRTEKAEQLLPGTTAWRPAPGYDVDRNVGYLSRTSARCGDRVDMHLSGPGPVQLSAYRVGWYGGAGARLVWTSPRRPSTLRPVPSLDPATRMVEANWPASASFQVVPEWTPGVYLIEVRPAGSSRPVHYGAVMPLVVEGDGQADLLAVASTLTWSSYNTYGGYSTYFAPTKPEDRSLVSSMDRPLVGSGLRHALIYDLPLVRFLSRLELDVDWTTDEGLDARPTQAGAHTGILLPGHSEYWTTRMYDAVEAARNQGVNVAFFGADPVYWQTRLTASPLGPRRRMIIYRDADKDPAAASSPGQATVRWRDSPLYRDEAELVGTTYARSNVSAGMQVTDAPDWLLAGTGLTTGSSLPRIAANEVDTFSKVRGAAPPNLQILLQGAFSTAQGALGDFASVYYTVPGGGAVFAAGTTAWPCDLEADCPFGPVPAATAQAVRIMTANVVEAFATQGFAVSHPSHSTSTPSLAAFWTSLPAGVRGTAGARSYGGLDDD